MARTKQPSRKATQKPQPDPWLTWCSSEHKPKSQPWLLDYPRQCRWFERDPAEFLEHMKESFVLKRLIVAAEEISSKSRDIVPEAPDVKRHPVPSLNFRFSTGERSPYSYEMIEVSFDDLLDDNPISPNLFRNLLMFAIAWPHPQAVEQLKKLAPIVIQLLMAVHRFLLKKIALAKTMGLKRASKKLEEADMVLCMIEFSGDINKDAQQLFLAKKMSPNDFRIAIRKAFMLDRQATEEINNKGTADTKRATAQENNTDNPPRKQAPLAVRHALWDAWIEYKTNPDKYTPCPLIRRKGEHPDYPEFIKYRGDHVIYDGKTLSQLLNEYKNPKEEPEDTLTRIFNNFQKNKKKQCATPQIKD